MGIFVYEAESRVLVKAEQFLGEARILGLARLIRAAHHGFLLDPSGGLFF